MLEAVLFDMDGVLIDSEPIHTEMFLSCAVELGCVGAEEDMDAFVGRSAQSLWAHVIDRFGLSGTAQEYTDMQMQRYREHLAANKGRIHPTPGVPELLTELADKGVPAALASSNTRENVDFVLEYFGLDAAFAATVSGDDGLPCKPAPDIFLRAAGLAGASPGGCVVLEDASAGVLAAKNAGMACVGFENPHSGRQDLSLADLRVGTLSALDHAALSGLVSKA